VSDPLGRPVDAVLLEQPNHVFIAESAHACGYETLRDEERDAWRTSTFGVGELIRAALDLGARHLRMGLGGSATVDGGAGMLSALGARLLDGAGRPITPNAHGLTTWASLDTSALDPRLGQLTLEGLADVAAPLAGLEGARQFMTQKGILGVDQPNLESHLIRWAKRLDVDGSTPGSGAAGGLGVAVLALGGRLTRGAAAVFHHLRLDAAYDAAAIVLSGAGQLADETPSGRAIARLSRPARVL